MNKMQQAFNEINDIDRFENFYDEVDEVTRSGPWSDQFEEAERDYAADDCSNTFGGGVL